MKQEISIYLNLNGNNRNGDDVDKHVLAEILDKNMYPKIYTDKYIKKIFDTWAM